MQPRACLIDALGTTVRLLPPWERLDPALTAGIDPERVRRAFAAEMTHYAAHAHEARDADSLAELRTSNPGWERLVVCSPPAGARGVRKAVEQGADGLVWEPAIETTLAITVQAVLRIDRDGGGGDLSSLAELPAALAGGPMGEHAAS